MSAKRRSAVEHEMAEALAVAIPESVITSNGVLEKFGASQNDVIRALERDKKTLLDAMFNYQRGISVVVSDSYVDNNSIKQLNTDDDILDGFSPMDSWIIRSTSIERNWRNDVERFQELTEQKTLAVDASLPRSRYWSAQFKINYNWRARNLELLPKGSLSELYVGDYYLKCLGLLVGEVMDLPTVRLETQHVLLKCVDPITFEQARHLLAYYAGTRSTDGTYSAMSIERSKGYWAVDNIMACVDFYAYIKNSIFPKRFSSWKKGDAKWREYIFNFICSQWKMKLMDIPVAPGLNESIAKKLHCEVIDELADEADRINVEWTESVHSYYGSPKESSKVALKRARAARGDAAARILNINKRPRVMPEHSE